MLPLQIPQIHLRSIFLYAGKKFSKNPICCSFDKEKAVTSIYPDRIKKDLNKRIFIADILGNDMIFGDWEIMLIGSIRASIGEIVVKLIL